MQQDPTQPNDCLTEADSPQQVYQSGQCASVVCPTNASYVLTPQGTVTCACHIGLAGTNCDQSVPFPWSFVSVNHVTTTCTALVAQTGSTCLAAELPALQQHLVWTNGSCSTEFDRLVNKTVLCDGSAALLTYNAE